MKGFFRSTLVRSITALIMFATAIAIPLSSPRSVFAAFSLDPTFGNGGKVITSFSNDANVTSIALQSDGRVVAVGASNTGHLQWVIERDTTDGSLDTSFGIHGIVMKDFGADSVARSVKIQPNGKIVVGG